MISIVRKKFKTVLSSCCCFSILLVSSLTHAATSIEMGGTVYVVNLDPSGSLITTESGQAANLSSDEVTRLINAAVLASDVSAYVSDLGSERATTALLNTVGEMDTIAEVQLARSVGNVDEDSFTPSGAAITLISVLADVGSGIVDATVVGNIVEDGISNLVSLRDYEESLRSTGAVLLTGRTISIEELESTRTTLESAQMHEQIIMAQSAAAYGYMNDVGLVTAIPNTFKSEGSFVNSAGLVGINEEDAKVLYLAVQATQLATGSLDQVLLGELQDELDPKYSRLWDEYRASQIKLWSVVGLVETLNSASQIYDEDAGDLNPDFVNEIYDQAEEVVLADREVRESLSTDFIQYQLGWQRTTELQALKEVEQEKVVALTEQASEKQQQASKEQEEAEAQAALLDRHLSLMHKDLRYLANETEDLIEQISDVGLDYESVLQLRKDLDDNIDDWESRRNLLSRESALLQQVVGEFEEHSYVSEWTINGRTFKRSELQTYKTMLAEQLLILSYAEKIVGVKGDRTADDRYPAYLALAKLEDMEDSLKASLDAQNVALLSQSNLDAYNAELADLQLTLESFEENNDFSFVFVEQTQFGSEETCLLLEGCGGAKEGISDTQKENLQTETVIASSTQSSVNVSSNGNSWSGFQVIFKESSGTGAANATGNAESADVEPFSYGISADGQGIGPFVWIGPTDKVGTTEFSEDFENGFGSKWQLHGSPLPTLSSIDSVSGDYSFKTNGDANYSSGAIHVEGIPLEPGMVFRVESKIHALSSSNTNPWQHHDIVVSADNLSNFTGCCSINYSDRIAALNHHGEQLHGTATPGGGVWFRDESQGTYLKTSGTANYGDWVEFAIEINGDGSVTYYQDGISVYRTEAGIATPYFGQDVRLHISGRDASTVNLIDNVFIEYSDKSIDSVVFSSLQDFSMVVCDDINCNGQANYQTTNSAELDDYNYLTWGTWTKEFDGSQFSNTNSSWIAGDVTPGGNIPTNGTAAYAGKVDGLVNDGSITRGVAGNASLTADFANRSLAGSFNNMKLDNNSNWNTLNVNASWGAGVNSINGTVNGGGATGTVNGHFFGPNAEEMGGSWQTTNGAEKAAGIFRAKQ